MRLGLLNVNHAEYTDGILAVAGSQGAQAFWPPLYGWLCAALGVFGAGPETAGKLISAFAGALLVLPIYSTARTFAGPRAAAYACLWYLVSPMALRWGIRMMTDALFALLFFTAIWALGEAWRRRQSGYSADGLLGLATASAAAATLTRYQGIILIPVVLFAIGGVWASWRRLGKGPMFWTTVSQALWLLPAAWFAAGREQLLAHGEQVSARMGTEAWITAVKYWSVFESFVLLSPYFFTYPILALAVWGTIQLDRRQRYHLLLFAYCALALLAMQSVFQSFQSRYLLPLLPFLAVYAGIASARICESSGKRRSLWWTIVGFCVLYCYGLSLAVVIFQRGVFGDVKSAARFVAENAPPNAPVFSNEAYGPQTIPIKMRFWSGRDVQFWKGEPLPLGAIVCLHNFAGQAAFAQAARHLQDNYEIRMLARFDETIVPLLPDEMATDVTINGMTFSPRQDPLAWVMRYSPQRFETAVIQIEGAKH